MIYSHYKHMDSHTLRHSSSKCHSTKIN